MFLRYGSILVLAGLALGGCAGDSGGSADLDYSGNENGNHTDSTKCNSDGTLTSAGKIDNGSVRLVVTDGSGNQLYSQTYTSSVDAGAESMHGASGPWTLEATRSGSGTVLGAPFSGHYTFHLAC